MASALEILNDIRNSSGSLKPDDVIRLATLAQSNDPLDIRSLIDIAICLRDYGCLSDSKKMCYDILKIDSSYIFALYELATAEAMQGYHVDALINLEKILKISPCDERALAFAARMSARIGDYISANIYVDRVDEKSPTHPDVSWIRELIIFMEEFPAGVADRLTQIYETDNRYVCADTITGWVISSLQNGEGFSLIRLGDGEGAFCRISSKDEAKYSSIYEYCRQNRANVWFNNEIDIHASGFVDKAFSLRQSIVEANVVGMPYRSWLDHEYKFCGPTGIICLVNALRLGQLPSVKRGQSWTSQSIHMDLLRTGGLEKIIKQNRKINLITCLSDAKFAIEKYFEIEEVRLYQIPGEKLHASLLGEETSIGSHYPDRFQEIMESLSRPLNGQLFLVAAGILGKIYCNQIKIHGGVALDIGSVVDAWMGKMTRPDVDPGLSIKRF